MELLALAIGTKINIVPYSVGTTHMNGLLGGEISSASSVLSSVSSLARAGKIRFLATTSPLKDFPDVPTFASRGYPQVDLEVGFFVVGPAGMPKEVTDVLLPAIEHAVKSAKITTTMDGLGTRVFYGGPKQLADHVGKELDVVTELARKLKLSSDK
jgi:tripartite-type tricarboxylate transporter receptor subunit TctC